MLEILTHGNVNDVQNKLMKYWLPWVHVSSFMFFKFQIKTNKMAVPFSNTKLRVPKGFQNILEGLARELLRNQPANSFEFGAKYFEQLLRDRAGNYLSYTV